MGRGDALTVPSDPGDALEAVTGWPAAHAAAGVIGLVGPDGPGARPTVPVPSPAVVATVGDVDRVFAWASVSKVLVALAVLVAAEEGSLSLDDAAGPPGSTVRHLLAHASGLGPESLAPLTGPGRRRIYSNVGYEILADTLARHSAMPFVDYLSAGVLLPLAMSGTALAPGASPASGVRGPLRDLLALGGELLAPRLVSPATLAEAATVAFPGLAGVLPGFGRFDPCDWGLGFEIRDAKSPHWTGSRNSPATFGHFGQTGSFLWVDPVAQVACGALCDLPFGPWAVAAWPSLADAVLGGAGPAPAPVAGMPDRVT